MDVVIVEYVLVPLYSGVAVLYILYRDAALQWCQNIVVEYMDLSYSNVEVLQIIPLASVVLQARCVLYKDVVILQCGSVLQCTILCCTVHTVIFSTVVELQLVLFTVACNVKGLVTCF